MISVIVPYWNSEQWLDRCCRSLHGQRGEFEFLLVDDHSTDEGLFVVSKYAEIDDRFKMLTNERTKGVSGARNTGLDHAAGDWITFLDADDEMLEDAWATFNAVVKVKPKANIHQLNHVRYYARIHKQLIKHASNGGVYRINNLPWSWWGVWNKLFRAEFLKDIRFDEEMQYGEDGMFVLECLVKDGKIHHADRRLVTTRHRFDNKASLSHIKTADDILKQIRKYEEFMFRQDDAAIKRLVCLELSKLWERMSRSME